MAIAGLHKSSIHDTHHGENHSPASRRCYMIERSTTRTSSIRKMWQDLESEGKCESMESEETLGDTNEIENERPQNQNQNQIAVPNGQEDGNRLCLQRSPSLGVPEKERVRKVFRDWGSKSFEGHMSNCSSVGQNECKRVRIELNGTSQMEQVHDGSVDLRVVDQRSIRRIYGRQALLDLLAKFVRERKREIEGLLENQFVSNFAHRHRIQALLKGRFLRNQRFVEDEKQTSVAASELGLLRQTHAVSDIRKGFLSRLNNYDDHTPEVPQSDSDNGIKYEEAEELPDESVDKFETNNLTSNWEAHNPQQIASPIGETNDPQSDSDSSSDNDMKYDKIEQAEVIAEKIPDETEKLPAIVEFTETRSQNQEETNQKTYHSESSQETLGTDGPLMDEVVSLQPLQTSIDSLNWLQVSQAEEEWQESVTEDDESEWHHHLTRTNSDEGIDVNSPVRSDSQESHDDWFGGNYSYQETPPSIGRSNALFYWSDDDNNDSRFELTQLANRRTVSTLLQSDFGPRLDQLLMKSYVNRQDEAFESENEGDIVIPETQGDNDIINGLRDDMDKLQQRMNDIQMMLEACMDMQLELQRSVHQELYSALNPSSPGKKGVCFLCRDDDFESRTDAHMYICSQCVEKINWSKLKESVR